MRLRRGKSRPRGSHSIGISETTAPCSAMRGSSGRFRRIELGMAAGEHADRSGRERGDMRALVDAARQTRHDDIARRAEAARKTLGEGQAGGRGVARADDGDAGCCRASRGRAGPGSAAARRVAQGRRIFRLASRRSDAELSRRVELPFDLLDCGDADRPAGAAASRQFRQRRERPPRAAET